MKDQVRVGVILLNWNGGPFAMPCIDSYTMSYQPWKIIVFDNASSDGSLEAISLQFPQITLIRSKQNLGFAEGNNVGICQLLAEGATTQ